MYCPGMNLPFWSRPFFRWPLASLHARTIAPLHLPTLVLGGLWPPIRLGSIPTCGTVPSVHAVHPLSVTPLMRCRTRNSTLSFWHTPNNPHGGPSMEGSARSMGLALGHPVSGIRKRHPRNPCKHFPCIPACSTGATTGETKKSKKSKKSKGEAPAGDGVTPAAATEFMIRPESSKPSLKTEAWPLLLRNYDQLECRAAHYTPIPSGCSPLKRELKEYIRYGVINLDKPANPSSHEVGGGRYVFVCVCGCMVSLYFVSFLCVSYSSMC